MSESRTEPLAYSVVIPAYSEAKGLPSVLKPLLEAAPGAEIIVVDDGSTDGTAEVARAIGGQRVRVLQHAENRGYGAALKTGIRAASHDVIVIVDADGTYPVDRIGELVERAREADMVVGARVGLKRAIPLYRRPTKWLLRHVTNYLVRGKVPDPNSGLRVIHRRALERFMNLLPEGFSFTTTLTLAMHVNGCRVEYVPVAYRPRLGRSKIRPLRDTGNFIKLILRTTLYFDPLRVFGPLSAVLFAASLAVLIYGVVSHNILDGTIAVLFTAGLQMLSIGLVADLINRKMGR